MAKFRDTYQPTGLEEFAKRDALELFGEAKRTNRSVRVRINRRKRPLLAFLTGTKRDNPYLISRVDFDALVRQALLLQPSIALPLDVIDSASGAPELRKIRSAA